MQMPSRRTASSNHLCQGKDFQLGQQHVGSVLNWLDPFLIQIRPGQGIKHQPGLPCQNPGPCHYSWWVRRHEDPIQVAPLDLVSRRTL
jgi:hypothetical protein